nr:hypothetical protein [uncultured Neisseria sp.]
MSSLKKIARIYYVKSHKTINSKSSQGKLLLIDKKEIKFLRDTLLETSQFKELDENNWYLSFFTDSEDFCQHIHVNFYCNDDTTLEALQSWYSQDWYKFNEDKKLSWKEYDDLCRLALMITKKEKPSDEEVKVTCASVRDSKSIQIDDLWEASTHYGHIDGRGLMFLTHMERQEVHFQRHIILLALAHAYLGAIESINNKLSQAISLTTENKKSIQELHNIYLQIAKFNARYMFSQPVKRSSTSLTMAWKRIEKALNINEINYELTEQINMIHYILKIDDDEKQSKQEQLRQEAERREAKQNQKISNWLTFIGVTIGIIGLISVFKDLKELLF